MSVDALKKMLSCVQVDGRNASHALIVDQNAGATAQAGAAPVLRRFTLSGLGPGDLVVVPDLVMGATDLVSVLLSTSSETDQNRMCDIVLLRVDEEAVSGVSSIDVCYIEMKSGNPSGYSGQFLSAQCFFKEYVVSLLEQFYERKCRIRKERFVVLHTAPSGRTPSARKIPTRPKSRPNGPREPLKKIIANGASVTRIEVLN